MFVLILNLTNQHLFLKGYLYDNKQAESAESGTAKGKGINENEKLRYGKEEVGSIRLSKCKQLEMGSNDGC